MNRAPPESRTFAHDCTIALSEVQRALGTADTAERAPLFVDVRELFGREFPDTQWRVRSLIADGGTAIIGAEPKSAKTWFMAEIAVAVATGTPAFGEFQTVRGTVAYFFAEDLAVQVRNRIRALIAPRNVGSSALGDLYVCPRGKFLDITTDEDLAWLVASCRQLGKLDLLVLDPLRDISSAAENESDEMAPVMKRLRLVGELLGCTVAVCHHAGKPTADNAKRRPGQKLRGSSAIYGSIDSGIYFGIRGGDGVSRFDLEVDVEIKGARSAGHFGLSLEITDDADGGAVRADWTVSHGVAKKPGGTMSRGVATKPSPDPQDPKGRDDEQVFAFVRDLANRGEVLSRRRLRDHGKRPIPEKRTVASLERLIDAGRLTVRDGVVTPPDDPSPRGDS